MTGQTFPLHVRPRLPDGISRLAELAGNLWFSWHRPTRDLFAMLDRELWWKTGRNPRLFLRCVDQGLLELAAVNDTFLANYRRALAEFDSYRERQPAGYRPAALAEDDLIAYFCAEFGYHESFPIYSGGLGILAGDHCKTASDLRLPFVAIGLLYRQGYFNQHIDEHGQQVANYAHIDASVAPVTPARGEDGAEVVVSCAFPGREIFVRVWQAEVGRVPVLLLDTDMARNEPADRAITRQLYGGDNQMRLQQELVLGVAGVRALRAAGLSPRVWHINEGHAAFQLLERMRELVASGLDFATAQEAVAANTVFTTHTPVTAGHDVFDGGMITPYLEILAQGLGVDVEALHGLAAGGADRPGFNMTRLALACTRHVNAVSRIHRRVTAGICASAWPEVPAAENPVGYVTNGVHVPTFMQPEWSDLLEQQLDASWHYKMMDKDLLRQIEQIPDGRFWYTNQQVKVAMLQGLRERLRRQHSRNRMSEAHIHRLLRHVDPDRPDVLTVGFARRFATYKRATLLLNDLGWLRQITGNEEQPVIFIFAGKAHPADHPAQQLMRELSHVANQPEFFGKLLLVEGYDMGLGRLLTSGVDVWLNTPIHPLEASGTSGMKAAINGTVNLSVMDGWWAEAYDGTNGWAIPPSPHGENPVERDRHDARTLYEILQDEVIPLYYARDERLGYSPGWVQRCKRSMATVLPGFNMGRVVHDYAALYYGPAARHGRALAADQHAGARALAAWKQRARSQWPGVALHTAQPPPDALECSDSVALEVLVQPNGLEPEDIRIECVVSRELCSELTVPVPRFAARGALSYGVRSNDDVHVYVQAFTPAGRTAEGELRYRLDLQPPWCGALHYQIRAVPFHEQLSHPYEMGLMRWL